MKKITSIVILSVLLITLLVGTVMANPQETTYNRYWTNYKFFNWGRLMPFFNRFHPMPFQPKMEQPVDNPIEIDEPGTTDPGHGDKEQESDQLTVDEKKMIRLVNQERTDRGLEPLEVDIRLVKLAREKAQDMIDYNYFDHQSPNLGSPFDQMKAAGINYAYAGENLAGASEVEQAHINLMNSPGHRANILKERYTHIGIGVIEGGPYGKMYVQHFIQKW